MTSAEVTALVALFLAIIPVVGVVVAYRLIEEL